MVERLESVIDESEHLVNRIVEEAADAGAARALGFGGEVEHLADDAGFPEQVTVERRPELGEAGVELRDHAEAEEAVGRDLLVAAHPRGETAGVAARQSVERQMVDGSLPQEV